MVSLTAKLTRGVLPLTFLGAALLAPSRADATTAFARKYNMACPVCHTAFPELNPFGRQFKEAGYRLPGANGAEPTSVGQDLGSGLVLDPSSAIAIRAKAYIAQVGSGEEDEEEGGAEEATAHLRPLHELELISTVSSGPRWSGMLEVEAEDEADFAPEAGGAIVYRAGQALSLFGGLTSPFHYDPYNTLAEGGHRLSVVHHAAMNYAGSIGLQLRKDAQVVGLYGRAGKVFYLFSLTPGHGDPLGAVEDMDEGGRLAVDLGDKLAIGGFGYHAVAGDASTTRLGLDLNAWSSAGTFKAVAMYDTLDGAVTGELGWDLVHSFGDWSLVPLARIDLVNMTEEGVKVTDATPTAGIGATVGSGRVWLELSEPVTSDNGVGSPAVTLAADVVF